MGLIALPGYIDREAWAAWLEVRQAKKAPNTAYAQKLLLYEVQRIKDAGHDANEAIRQSILNGWKDVFVPKAKEIQIAASSQADATLAELDRRTATPKTAPPPEVVQLAERLRRRA